MAGSKHEYGLSWIDQDALYNGIKTIFSKALGLARPSKELPPDPFTILAQAAIADTSFEDSLDFEHLRALNKTISNAVGEMHQHILGLAKNWENLGRSGGLLDVCTVPGYVHPKFGKPVVAEVKNRFNTIKASDEPKEWDKIKDATKIAKRSSTKGAQGYLFQITPKTPQRYDHPWTPSHRTADPDVRVCDGATAYEIVFGHRAALKELYLALPQIFRDIRLENGLDTKTPLPDAARMAELYARVFPD